MGGEFLGKGARFPFQFNVIGGTESTLAVGVSAQSDHINESLQQILGTSPGERVMLPEFGSRLKELLFEPNDTGLQSLAKVYVVDAIRRWEKRIALTKVQITSDVDAMLLNIQISYTIIKDQVAGNLVYPFYLGQA